MSRASAVLAASAGGSDWPEWTSAIGTFTAAAVALALGLGLREWLSRPSLVLSSADDDPSSRMAFPLSDGRMGGWARIHVANEGRATARGIHVRVASIERWDGAAWVRERPELDARDLGWANTPSGESVDIPAGSARPLDFVSLHQGAPDEEAGAAHMRFEIALDRIPPPSSGVHVLSERGSWRVELVIDGENVEVMRRYVALGFSAQWWDPVGGNLWKYTAVISGPSSSAPTAPVEAPTAEDLLAAAAEEDAGPRA